MAVVNFKDAETGARDPANQAKTGRVTAKTERRGLFNFAQDAAWAADRLLAAGAYPLAGVRFDADRAAFRLEPGDAFRLNVSQLGIEQAVYRVASISEAAPDSEMITVSAVEDVRYLSRAVNSATGEGAGFAPATGEGGGAAQFWELDPFTRVAAAEAPYALVGEALRVVPLVGRETGRETGFFWHMSLDGSSYARIASPAYFCVAGELSEACTAGAFRVDDDPAGILVDFDNDDVDLVQTVTRAELFSGVNLAVIGNEILSFQAVTPVSGSVYRLTGLFRGRWDTEPAAHAAGAAVYVVKAAYFSDNPQFLPGATRYFKAVPHSATHAGDISEASAVALPISGRAATPYRPGGLAANGEGFRPSYTDDIVLTWQGRVRGAGAGLGDPDTVTDAEPVWEGYFRVRVYVGGAMVREVSGLDALTWTYTSAMSLTDNGCLPTEVLFKLANYRTAGGVTYTSAEAVVTAYDAAGCDLGSATTTTTTTTSSTTTSTTTT